MNLAFEPDAARARALDRRMRAELALSLAHVAESIRSQMPDSAAARRCAELDMAWTLLRSDRRVDPALFANYYQLVLAAVAGRDDLVDLIGRTAAAATPRDHLTFHDMSEAGLGNAARLALYQASLDTDESLSVAFLPPQPAQSARTRESVLRGLALMRRTVPNFAGEIEGLVVEILLAAAAKEQGAARFDGASSYMLWGALALSVDDEKSDLEMMETLAHEASHSFLFGLTIEEPLVRNDDEDKYPSPLRADPRPMDGIYHAAYVSARMYYALDQARSSGLLDAAQLAECDARLQDSARAFRDGHAVVEQHGELTATGRAIMDDACRYMDGVAA